MSKYQEEETNMKNMPHALQQDFSIDHITNRVISEIIVLSDYRKLGISHLFSISGMHVSLFLFVRCHQCRCDESLSLVSCLSQHQE